MKLIPNEHKGNYTTPRKGVYNAVPVRIVKASFIWPFELIFTTTETFQMKHCMTLCPKVSKIFKVKVEVKPDISTLTCVFLIPLQVRDHTIPHWKALGREFSITQNYKKIWCQNLTLPKLCVSSYVHFWLLLFWQISLFIYFNLGP